tara:strand:+ start:1143 stop:1244 length:102 start_codon:yes stop_codon:yes gene_type:complete
VINGVEEKIDDMTNIADIYVGDWPYKGTIATDS